jgi:hypothetical protein
VQSTTLGVVPADETLFTELSPLIAAGSSAPSMGVSYNEAAHCWPIWLSLYVVEQ